EELRNLAAHDGRMVRDHAAPAPLAQRLDCLDPAHNAHSHVGGESIRRQLDRLLERDLAGAGGGGAVVGAVDVIGDAQIHRCPGAVLALSWRCPGVIPVTLSVVSRCPRPARSREALAGPEYRLFKKWGDRR